MVLVMIPFTLQVVNLDFDVNLDLDAAKAGYGRARAREEHVAITNWNRPHPLVVFSNWAPKPPWY